MTVVPISPALVPRADVPDEALPSPGDVPANSRAASFADALGGAFADAGASLERADRAERAFSTGRGGLQEMVLERAQADVALSLASVAASRASQSLSTILGMQV